MAIERSDAIRYTIGRRLAAARSLSKKRQEDVMKDVFNAPNPKNKNRISSIETGTIMPDAELLQKLCGYYNVSSDWVLGFALEPEIDRNLSRIGILYTSLFQSILPSVENVVQELAIVGARHMTELPKTCFIELLDIAKSLIRECQNSSNQAQIKTLPMLMSKVREIEIQLSRKDVEVIKYIDDFSEGLIADVENETYLDILKNKHSTSKKSKINQSIVTVDNNTLKFQHKDEIAELSTNESDPDSPLKPLKTDRISKKLIDLDEDQLTFSFK